MLDRKSLILAQDQTYSMDSYQTKVNNNVLVVGTSGSGKSRSIVSPNILQAHGSYIISDPKGTLYKKYGGYLKKNGYVVQKLDFTSPETSAHYNFFHYIHNQQDIIKLAHMITYSMAESFKEDPFWDQATEILLTSLIAFLVERNIPEEKNLESMLKLLAACQVDENSSGSVNALDRIMNETYKRNKDSFAYRQYQKFRIAAGKTLKSILITANSKLGKYDFDAMNRMLESDDIELASIGKRKTAVFVIVSDTDRSMDGMANIFFSQAMNELCSYADKKCKDGRLPVDVRFILDDFATSCRIDEFPRIISTIRSRGISTMLMIQAESQLTAGYKVEGQTIISNCDTYVYMGGNEIETARAVAVRADVPLRKILNMPVETCWIFRRGQEPVNARNFDLDTFEKQMRKSVKVQKLKEENGLVEDVAV